MRMTARNNDLASPPVALFAFRGASEVIAVCGVAAMLLGACSTTETFVSAPIAAAPRIPAESVVGRWGLASYHRDTDRERTLKEARSQCNNPYVIKAGTNGGVVMNLADEAEPSELQIKSSADGRTFIGRAGPPGEITDMELSAYDGKVMTIQYLDPDVTARYGTMVYVKCDQASSTPSKPKATGATG
ncbi:MAG: hypothetical protein K0S56_2787 [Microvirga sp.]|nr:hypothetical protein [Microvirga sp.]